MAGSSLANRLYRGEAGLNVVGRRKMWFAIAAVAILISIGSFAINRFHLGIEFAGGTKIQVPATAGTLEEVRGSVEKAVTAQPPNKEGEKPVVASAQRVSSNDSASYVVRTSELENEQSLAVKNAVAQDLGVSPGQISDSRVSAAWGEAVTRQAIIGLLVFLALVLVYLILRFEWRMAVAAVSSLLLDLVLTAGVYSLVGFEVTPSTVIGFLTILGFSLYDVVVVFDKVQENTRGITAGSSRTYSEAANLAVNQTIMRSINTGLVALLPVGGLLFIGAGLLGAGTLKDLGLVLFVGMGLGVLSSIMFASPMLAATTRLAQGGSTRAADMLRETRRRWAETIRPHVRDTASLDLVMLVSDGLYFNNSLDVHGPERLVPRSDELADLIALVLRATA